MSEKMSASEAFTETLREQGVKDVFGIVGSAFMDALDLFPAAGIRFLSVQHEQNAVHMADGYARVTDKHGVCVAQNGPGISNFLTGLCAAYWAHSPVVAITPEAGTGTKGLGGFQELDQYRIFEECTKYIGHVPNPDRIAEITSRAFDIAMNERGPTQVNFFRDHLYSVGNYTIPKPQVLERTAGGAKSLAQAVKLVSEAKNPVIIAGGGVCMGGQGAVDAVRKLAEHLSCPVTTTYLHNDSFPKSHELMTGPLGYQGHQSAMYSIKDADLVLALGTRLSPFGTNPQFGIDYWPKSAKLVQCDIDPRRVGLVKPVDVGICGDAGKVATEILGQLQGKSLACSSNKDERMTKMRKYKADWEKQLKTWNYDGETVIDSRMRPRTALAELEKAMPKNAMVATDIGNVCSVSNSYLRFDQPRSLLAAMTFGNCGYSFPAAMGAKVGCPDRPAIAYVGDGAWGMSLNEVLTCVREKIPTTAVVFHNRQWGAEKKNQVLWFGDRYVGVNLENNFSYAAIAKSMSAEGIVCSHPDEVGDALKQCVANQKDGKTTVLELNLTRELGDPFRRDAMKLPQRHLSRYTHTNEDSESATGQPVDLR